MDQLKFPPDEQEDDGLDNNEVEETINRAYDTALLLKRIRLRLDIIKEEIKEGSLVDM